MSEGGGTGRLLDDSDGAFMTPPESPTSASYDDDSNDADGEDGNVCPFHHGIRGFHERFERSAEADG